MAVSSRCCQGLLASPDQRRKLIGEELTALRQKFGDERRTRITGELQGLSKGRGAVAAYGRAGSPQPRYQDREG